MAAGLKKFGHIKAAIADRKKLLLIVAAGVVVSLNWYLYIWAVNSGHVLDSSLGYYINPLMVMALGVVVFKEKISRLQIVSVVLAAAGVLVLVVQYGSFPWVAVMIAATFAIYGMLKKLINIDPVASLTLETMVFLPVVIVIMAVTELKGTGVIGFYSPLKLLIVAGTGVVTGIPLMLFAHSANNVPLSIVGFLQYISPTISFFLGVFLYNEPFDTIKLISFALIWVALVFFTVDKLRGIGSSKS